MPPKFPTTTTPSSTTAAASRPRAQTFLPSESIKSPTSQVKKLPATSTTTTTKLADQLESPPPAASQRINNSFAGTKNTSFTGTKPTGSGSVDSTSTTQRDSPVPLSSAATVEKTVGNVTSPAKAASTVKPLVGPPPAAVVASGSSNKTTTTGSPAIAFPPTTEIATVPSQQEEILPPVLTPADEQQQPAAVVISPHHGPTAATVASISTLIAGMMEKKGNSTDETQEAARWMRSELVLLVEQANSLKERRLQLESRRAELLDAVTDHIVHLLPSHLLGGGGGGGSSASQSAPQPSSFLASHDNNYSSVLLQNTAISQAVSGRVNPWSMQHKITTTSSSPFPHHQQHAISNNNATHTATAPYYHSSRDETTNILNAALDAQRSLFRCMLSQRFLEHGGAAAGSDHQPHQLHQQDTPPPPGFSSTAGGATASSTSSPSPSRRMVPIAQEIADTQTETRKRNIELQVLTQREALLQQQSQSLLQEMRAELEKRDGLLKRRSELKKADSLASSAAANLASLSTSSLGSTASALLAEYSLQELRDRKAALHLEWQRLRAASAAKQQPYRESLSSTATSSGALNYRNSASPLSANTSFASNSSLPNATYESQSFRRSMDPTILLLPYAAVADSISAAHPYPQPSSYRSMTTGSSLQQQQQQHPHWVLPEQYLVRTL